MADNTLDRLSREHETDVRRWVATLIVVGGATNAQIAERLHAKFNVAEPTTRSVSAWRNNDAKLIALVDELEAIKRDMNPDATVADILAGVPEPVDPAEAAAREFSLCICCRPYAELVVAGAHEEARAALAEGHQTDADFEAACVAALAAYVPDDSVTGDDGGFYG